MDPAASDVDSSPATSEVSDDSEAGSLFSAQSFAAAEDEDDAESCSGGGCASDDDDCGGGDGDEFRDRGGRDRCRRMSTWRSWMMELAAMEEGDVGERRGAEKDAAEEDEMAVEETDESNRLFWETCLADGY